MMQVDDDEVMAGAPSALMPSLPAVMQVEDEVMAMAPSASPPPLPTMMQVEGEATREQSDEIAMDLAKSWQQKLRIAPP